MSRRPCVAVARVVAHAALQQVAQGVLQVAEVHQVVRQRIEHIIRVQRRDSCAPSHSE